MLDPLLLLNVLHRLMVLNVKLEHLLKPLIRHPKVVSVEEVTETVQKVGNFHFGTFILLK